MYREACRRKHVRKMPELRRNAGLTTPLLAGLFHTKLYLPATGYSARGKETCFFIINFTIIATGISRRFARVLHRSLVQSVPLCAEEADKDIQECM